MISKIGCTNVFLKGSRNQTGGSVNSYIASNRVIAVKKFMANLSASLKFVIEEDFISPQRIVKIRCTN